MNPTGGGIRNKFGSTYSQTALSAGLPKELWTLDDESRIKFGGNLRANLDSTFIVDSLYQSFPIALSVIDDMATHTQSFVATLFDMQELITGTSGSNTMQVLFCL